jgi:hypothetical protein
MKRSISIFPTAQNFASAACDASIAFSQGDFDEATEVLRRMDEMLRDACNRQAIRAPQHERIKLYNT